MMILILKAKIIAKNPNFDHDPDFKTKDHCKNPNFDDDQNQRSLQKILILIMIKRKDRCKNLNFDDDQPGERVRADSEHLMTALGLDPDLYKVLFKIFIRCF